MFGKFGQQFINFRQSCLQSLVMTIFLKPEGVANHTRCQTDFSMPILRLRLRTQDGRSSLSGGFQILPDRTQSGDRLVTPINAKKYK